MKYLAIDTETGGINKETSLLSAWFGVYDENFKLLDSLDLKLKPDNEIYIVEAQGMSINKIDLVEHDKTAKTYKEAKSILYSFILNACKDSHEPLIPVGHNVSYDIQKLTSTIISKGSWDSFVSYRKLDTGTISQFLKCAGILPADLDAGLGKLVKFFNLEFDGEAHTAEADAKATMEVYKKLVESVKK